MNAHRSILVALALAVPLIACDKQQEPEYPEGAGGYGAGYQGGQGAQYGTTQTTGTGAGGATTDTGGSTPTQATALPGGPLLSPMLRGTAQSDTAGMNEDGSAFGANFLQGQIFEQPFHIQPGRCYTVVALGMGISELDVEIVVQQPPAPEWVAASDDTAGPHAILGGKGQCFENPFPVGAPAKVRLKASAGSGMAVAQIYSR